MRKLMLLVALVAVAFVVSSAAEAKADDMSGCRGGGGYYGGYSYAPSYSYGYAPAYSYSAPIYNYGAVNSFGYGYPTTGFYYGRPGVSISIGSGYRGYNYGSYGGNGGYGGGHHHHR